MVHTRSVRAGNSSLPLGQGQPPTNLPPLIPPQIPTQLPPQLPPQVPIMFPLVDHAEGGDENQPHTSAHNSTSTSNQDVVAAQLAAMQQQFGVFQLNPQLVQLAPAISESQAQSHIAPAQQPIPDDVTRRLDSLEKLVAEHRGALPPHHATDSIPHPLNTNITLEPYPAGFKIPQLETYDGTKDPDDHLHAFYSCMQAQNASDALMCKIFPSTLRGNARTWYYSLPPRLIRSYTEMASAFATKFSSRRLIRKTTSKLMRVKQRDGESLKNYMSRFNDAVLEVSSFDQAMGIAAVISGLKHDRFRDSLIKHVATTFSEVNDRSLKFITAEEYALAQNPPPSKNQNPDWRDDNPSRKRMRVAQNRGPMLTSLPRFGRPDSTPPQQSAGKPPANWTPFNLPRSQIFMQIKNKMDLRRPGPMRTAVASRDHTRYCDFHQDHGHTTEQCNSLKSELESLAQKGMLNEYVQKAEQPRFVREQRLQPQGVRNPPNRQGVGYQQAPPPLPPPARIIHMITGGLEVGGLSSKQRKLYVREVKHQNRAQKRKIDDAEWKNQPITFTSADLNTVVTPHNDPLVTSVMINNCEVQRVLVDTGSALDIMYFHCFKSLGLDPALLQKYDGPIYGFNNQPVPVEGVLTLHVAFGSVVDPVMMKYVALVAELKCKFQKFCLSKIPRAKNEQADSLSKFASDSSLSSRSVFVEVLDEPSFTKPWVMEISTNPDMLSWTDSIVSFLRDGIVPEDSPYEAEYALREVHEGICGSHVGARTLAHKVLRQGYYWPNIYKDATYFVQKCPKCQFFAHLTHQPTEELTNMVAPWPFAQWGLDLLGPFVKGVGGVTHMVVGVDYFTKWVEARPLSSLTSKKVEDFVFSSIICRYGIPNQIVADNGTQFNCSSFRDFCSSYGIKLQFTSFIPFC
ncbi:hypothetical protein SLEP1_g22562 [Rubroshorea leprosula]|uniref:Integrase catalytic domain-containing protein n=1 Tax=Rubroshorea leprosula TaxID=152421 RepID=A0AAV5JIF6_9ROSI|nr:hypothetical protein SLEP1_g22562 [Rubroshorea leprosula]